MFGYVFHDINGPNLGQTLKVQWFLLNEIYGHPPAGLLWKSQFDEGLLYGKKCRIGNVRFVHRKQGLFLSVYVDDVKMIGIQQNMVPIWNEGKR